MRLEGEVFGKPDHEVQVRTRFILAHEVAHLWNANEAQVAAMRDSWIHEGSADHFAIRAMERLTDDYDVGPDYQERIDRCAARLAGGSLETAMSRGVFDAHYACGAIIALIVERVAAAKGTYRDHFAFYAELLNRAASKDGKYTADMWLALLGEASKDAALTRKTREFIRGDVTAERFYRFAFSRAGLRFVPTVELMEVPVAKGEPKNAEGAAAAAP